MMRLMGRGASAVPGPAIVTVGGGDRDSCAPMTTRVTATAKNSTTTTTGARETRPTGRVGGGWAGGVGVTGRLYRACAVVRGWCPTGSQRGGPGGILEEPALVRDVTSASPGRVPA